MEDISTILKLVREGCWMTSIDLKDAYYSVKICEEDQKFLKFFYYKSYYTFTCYPNGLSSCPRKFTKIFKPILAKFRKEGHIISCYIDDLYVQASSYEQRIVSTLHVISTLVQLGFVIHPDKSVLIPKQNITALGFNIDSCLMTVSITDAKILKIRSLIQETLKNKDDLKIRNVAKIIAQIVSTFPASRFGKLYYRHLEKDKSRALTAAKGNFEALMTVSEEGETELIWWLNNITSMYKEIIPPNIQKTLYSDASKIGWGG